MAPEPGNPAAGPPANPLPPDGLSPDSAAGGLQVAELACSRGGRPVFAGLSFTAPPGALALVRGANGSGKSSLLRILAGLASAAAGEIRFGGRRAADDPAAYRRRVLYVGHRNAVKPWLTVAENLQFWIACQGLAAGAVGAAETAVAPDAPGAAGIPGPAVAAALEKAGLGGLEGLPGAYLSFGQARRLALARLWAAIAPLDADRADADRTGADGAGGARLVRPLVLLDEPAVGLDRESGARLDAGLEAARAAGATIVLAAHGPVTPAADVTVDLDSLRRGQGRAPEDGPGREPEAGPESWREDGQPGADRAGETSL